MLSRRADLHVQVKPVVEVSTPEKMAEAQADVKRAVLLAQTEQPEDVNKVLVPPGHGGESEVNHHTHTHTHVLLMATHQHFFSQICSVHTPQDFITSRRQVAVNKPKRCSIEVKGDTNGPLVPCGKANIWPQTYGWLKTHFLLLLLLVRACTQGAVTSCRG